MLNDYVGIPFADGGRGREGCDCWGLYRLVIQDLTGVSLPDFGIDYADTDDRQGINGAVIRETSSEVWQAVVPEQARLGDCVTFKLAGLASHVGCVIRPGVMLHVQRGINAVIEPYTSLSWRKRILGIYRHHQVPAIDNGITIVS